MGEGEYLTLTEAAKRLNVSRWTVYRRIDEGALQMYDSPANRRVKLVRRSEVEALLRPQSATPVEVSGTGGTDGRK